MKPRRRRFAPVLMISLALCQCTPVPTAPTAKADPAQTRAPLVVDRAPTPAPAIPSGTTVEGVTMDAAAAKANGLPEIGWHFVPDGRLSVSLMPTPQTYFTASGPPGGVLFVQATALGEQTLEQWVAADAKRSGRQVIGKSTTVRLAGADRRAIGYLGGEGLARAIHCAIEIRTAAGAATLLLAVDAGSESKPLCSEVMTMEVIATIVSTLEIS